MASSSRARPKNKKSKTVTPDDTPTDISIFDTHLFVNLEARNNYYSEEFSMDFRSPMHERVYAEDFVHRSIVFSKTVQFDEFHSMEIKEMCERIDLLGLCELSGSCCTRAIRLFYANMYVGDNVEHLKTYVFGRELLITPATINAIIRFPLEDDAGILYYHASRECDFIKAGQGLEFLKLVHRNANIEVFVKPSSKDLNTKAKVVHNMISHTILPRDGPRDLVSHMDLYVMEKLYNGRRLNPGYVILNHMKHISMTINTSMGYSTLIQKILEHFNVPIPAHETIRKQRQYDYFNKSHLCQMGLVESDSVWLAKAKRCTRLTSQDIDMDASSADNCTPMQKLDILITNVRQLNDRVEEMTSSQREIRQGMKELRQHYLYLSARVFNRMSEHKSESSANAAAQVVDGAAPTADASPEGDAPLAGDGSQVAAD